MGGKAHKRHGEGGTDVTLVICASCHRYISGDPDYQGVPEQGYAAQNVATIGTSRCSERKERRAT